MGPLKDHNEHSDSEHNSADEDEGQGCGGEEEPMLTFGAAYPHHGLEADLAGEVPLEVLLEALHLGGVMLVVVGGVVVHASCRVPGYASCREEGAYRS